MKSFRIICHVSSTRQAPRSIARSLHTSRPAQSSADAQAIADAFLSKFAGGKQFVRKQFLDVNQLRLFSLTLDRPHLWPGETKSLEDNEPAAGTPIPPGYHLIYFTPGQLPGILGIDGTDASFNPEAPFTRRMWAGGSVHWPGADPSSSQQHYLKVGEEATETTKVLSCEAKTIKKTGESMLVVGVEKEFRDAQDNLCVLDKRNWVFREALDPSKPATPPSKPAELSQQELDEAARGQLVREYNRDAVQLFRMSALTFNGHRIHYDLPWARNVEGHRGLVVHGPLNQISVLDMWRDEKASRGGGEKTGGIVYPQELKYRATSPVYAGEGYRILIPSEGMGSTETDVQVVSNDGTVCMKGTVYDW